MSYFRWLSLFFTLSLYASVKMHFDQRPNPPIQFHEGEYKLGWDIDFSPYAGGENVLFIHRSIERAEGWLLDKSAIRYSRQSSARLWRLSELFFGYIPLNYFAMVVQHEIFGHGYRIRSLGSSLAKVTGYSIYTPPPYGFGGGATSFKISDQLTTTEETSISMAGVEATAILALLTKLKWLASGAIDPRQSVLYLLCQYDLPLYIGSLKTSGSLNGHDISEYIHSLDYTYPASFLRASKLRALSWINLVDPFTYYSMFSWFHYVSSGKETSIPMIPAWGWGYLPGVRLGLTPFGPEYFVENFLLKGNSAVYFYGKGGAHGNNDYYGFGFYAPQIWRLGNWKIGLRFDGWRQPRLLLQPGNILITEIDFNLPPDPNNPLYPYGDQNKIQYGAASSFVCSYKKDRTGLECELGYKSKGFLPGYSLQTSPVARLFFTLFF